MTLREFYDRLIRIKYHSMEYISTNVGKQYCKRYFARMPDLTYSDAKAMYEFLKFYRWDFNGAYIVIHYPEITIANRHTIKDLYFAFNPIHITYFPFKATRSTYSLHEIQYAYLHSHISSENMFNGFTRSICFGDTTFRSTGNTCDDFINFLIYLDTYLRHEYPINPYNRIDNLYQKFNLDATGTLKIPLHLFDYKIGYMNKVKMLIPQYTSEADVFFTKALGNAIKVSSLFGKEVHITKTTLTTARVNNGNSVKNNIDTFTNLGIHENNNFIFQNELITYKTEYDESSETKTSEQFKKYVCEKIAPFATASFMEAYSQFEPESAESLELHLQEN